LNIELSPLIELQRLDLRIAEASDRRRRIPERLHTAEAPVRDARRIRSEASSAVETYAKEKRSHEKDLEAHEDRIDKMKDRASQLKTNQEYQAHLFELDLANKKKGEIEEKILLAMEKIDQLQRLMKDAQTKEVEAEQRYTEEKASLDEEDRRLAAELEDLESKHQNLTAKIDKSLLDRYTKLRSTRKDHALAGVKDGICRGCRLQLPPQLVAQVKRMADVHTCPYCHRMLYWDGGPVAESRKNEEPEGSQFEVGESV
jgi:predicted  nucleic acid-binding Zn-ribbon protein